MRKTDTTVRAARKTSISEKSEDLNTNTLLHTLTSKLLTTANTTQLKQNFHTFHTFADTTTTTVILKSTSSFPFTVVTTTQKLINLNAASSTNPILTL